MHPGSAAKNHRTRWLGMPWRNTVIAACLVALSSFGNQPASIAAQEATAPLPDLAAMVLLPSDLPEAGFMLEGGRRISPEEEAASIAAYRDQVATPEATTDLSEALIAAGYRSRYVNSMALPSSDDPGWVAVRVLSYVTYYDTPEGAATGFALIEDESAIPTASDLPPSRAFADEAEITSDSGLVGGSDQPYRSLDLTFRRGNLTGGVLIYDNLDREIDQAMLEDLGERLLQRIDEVLSGGGPELGNRIVRLGQNIGIDFNDETYERRAGITIPYIGESSEALAAREANYGEAVDVYSIYQALVLLDGISNDDPYYVGRLYRFPDEAAASRWMTNFAERLPHEGSYVDVAVVPEAPAFGDESVTLSYGYQPLQTLTTRGTVIVARVGAIVARVQVDALYEADPVGVRALMEMEIACLTGGVCPPIVPVPEALLVPGPAPVVPNPFDPF